METGLDTCKILLVDDVEMNLIILSEIIKSMGHIPLTAQNAADALKILENEYPELILLDISMPDISGLEFCKMLKQDVYTRDIPVIFISALDSSEDLKRGFETGAIDYIMKPFDPENVKVRVDIHLNLFRTRRELEEANKRLNTVIKNHMIYNRNCQKEIFSVMAELAAERDTKRTYSRISEPKMARMLAQALQFSPLYENEITDAFLECFEIAASMHDIGTVKIPDEVALKEDELNDEELEILKKHPIYGFEKVDKLSNIYKDDELLNITKNVILYHHENYDGTGFPEGLKGDDIPLCARIMRVVDVYEAIVNDRIYHKALSHEEAVEIIKEGAGTSFDPNIVDVFIKICKRFI